MKIGLERDLGEIYSFSSPPPEREHNSRLSSFTVSNADFSGAAVDFEPLS